MALDNNSSSNPSSPTLTIEELLIQIQRRAIRFFWEKADRKTGLVNDRAKNFGRDNYTVASIASTGYALAALPIAVQHGWQTSQAAYERGLLTLQFIHDTLAHKQGWYYHFVTKETGIRVWQSEVSSIDTALLIAGCLVCGQYFAGSELQQLANSIYERVDWHWMLTNGGAQPSKQLLAHGWKPETGFLANDWDSYCELMVLYLLGMGSQTSPLSAACWQAWSRPLCNYKTHQTLWGGPIFVHQMSHGFYDFAGQRDAQGWNYWVASREATLINRQFCMDQRNSRLTYDVNVWGINAGDYPGGYKAFSAPGEHDGTVSPTGAVASVLFTPELSKAAALTMYNQYGRKIWGKYGFSNGFNVDQGWYDRDVIGIDLGMALLAIENAQTGLIWQLIASHPSTAKAWHSAGFSYDLNDSLYYAP